MKEVKIEYFNATAIVGYGYRLGDTTDTLEEMKQKIDESNERRRASGYDPEKWIITLVKIYRAFTDDHRFIKSEETEQAVCIYPAEL